MGLLSKFTKRSDLSPIAKIANGNISDLETKFENSVSDLFSRGLSSAGLSSSTVNKLSARFGDSLASELADEFFKSVAPEINRVDRADILGNVSGKFAETNVGAITRIDDDPTSVNGVKDVYQFPNQIGKYYVNLKFREYVRPAPQIQAKLNFKNAVVLPIPSNLEEAFSLNVSQEATGIAGGIADVFQTATSDGAKDFSASSSAGALAYSFLAGNGLSDTARYFGLGSFVPSISTNTQSLIGQYLGNIPNPHMATIFNGVQMRQFSFDWTFNPRNPKESADLEELIKIIKQNSLPAFSTLGTAVLQYPFLCFVELQPWQSDGEPLIEYKPALVANVRVNKSPNGIPSFFEGTNLPTFIQLSIDFLETEYFTAEDFGRSGRTAEEGDKLGAGVETIKGAIASVLEVVGVEDGEAAVESGLNEIDKVLAVGSNSKVEKNPDGSDHDHG